MKEFKLILFIFAFSLLNTLSLFAGFDRCLSDNYIALQHIGERTFNVTVRHFEQSQNCCNHSYWGEGHTILIIVYWEISLWYNDQWNICGERQSSRLVPYEDETCIPGVLKMPSAANCGGKACRTQIEFWAECEGHEDCKTHHITKTSPKTDYENDCGADDCPQIP